MPHCMALHPGDAALHGGMPMQCGIAWDVVDGHAAAYRSMSIRMVQTIRGSSWS
jgi:hypothetical protein